MQRSNERFSRIRAFSVPEAIIAVAIIGLTLGAMMTLNGHQLRMVKVSRDMNAATLYQQERVEQLRQARWPDLTSASYVSGTYMTNRPASRMALNQISESITLSPYPANAASGVKSLTVSQTSGESPVVDSAANGFGLGGERLVKVEMLLAWKGADGRPKQRSTTTLISNGGVTRNSLPALGPVSGGVWDNFSTPPPAETSTPTATPPPTNGNGNNGNGNGDNGNGKGKGKGNTGGQTGQG